MKTKLLAICLFLVTSQVFADCSDDLDVESSYKYLNSSIPQIRFIIKNKTKNLIIINHVGLWANDNETVMRQNKIDILIQPFGKSEAAVFVHDLNLDVAGKRFYSCAYK